MRTNPGLPAELRDHAMLHALQKAGEFAARTQTRDALIVEDAGMHGLEALMQALLRPNPPAQSVWTAYVRKAAFRYAQGQDRRAQREQHAGRAGSALPPLPGMDGIGVFDKALGRGDLRQSLGSRVAAQVDAEKVNPLLEALAPLERRLLKAKYLEGKPTRQIAEDERMTEKMVEHRLRRAKSKLKEDL